MEGFFSAVLGFLFSEAGLYCIIAVLAIVLLIWIIRSIGNAISSRSEARRKAKVIDGRIDPLVKAVTDAGAKRERGPTPDLSALAAAAKALLAEIEAVDGEILLAAKGLGPKGPGTTSPKDTPKEQVTPKGERPEPVPPTGDIINSGGGK